MPDFHVPDIPDTCRLTPEFRLLAACSWIAPSELEQGQAEKIASLCRGGIDWNAFIPLVRRHGVPTLAYSVLCRFADEWLPDDVRETLRERDRVSRFRALFQASELVRLIKLLAGQGIDSVPLKGIALSQQLYSDPGMRSSTDIDILIKPQDLDQACRILESEGYQSSVFGQEMTKRQKKYVTENFYHLEYVHNEKSLCIELHWSFGSLWLPEQTRLVWNNLRSFEWMGTSINIIDENFLLLILCDHGVRHRYCCLKWLSDIVMLIAGTGVIDWEKLEELADCLDLKRTVAHTGLVSYWTYGIPLPDRLKTLIIHDRTAVNISSKVFELLSSSSAGSAFSGSRLGGIGLAWQIKRIRPSIPLYRLFKSNLLHPIDFQLIRLPDILFWLYYPLRPLLGVWRLYVKK